MIVNRIIIAASLLFNAIALLGILYCFNSKKEMIISNQKQITKKRIAIFEPVIHPAIKDIEEGFITELKRNVECDCIVFNANGNKTLLRGQAEEILQNNYDLIFTIGALCTQTIKELCSKRNIQTPVVFSSIDDPIGMGIVKHLESSGNNFTGVIEHSDYKQQLSLLFMLKPSIKNVLLVYDPTHGTGRLQQDKEVVSQLLHEYGATLKVVEVSHANELQQKVTGFLNDVDAVLILKDNTIVSGVDVLIKLCNQYGVTLYASDLNSADKGAALAYGITEQESGIQAAYKAVLILHENKFPTNVPITVVTGQRLNINSKNMVKQKLTIEPKTLLLLQMARLV
jgi:putative tryptophan/tyrosine transport system substrate-binding protein